MKELGHISKGSLIYPACWKLEGAALAWTKNDATACRNSVRAGLHQKQTAI